MWGREGDPGLPPEIPGHGQLVIHHLDFELEPIQSPLTIDVPALAYYSGLTAVGLDHPESMLLSWSALAPENPGRNAIYLSRLDCVPEH